MPDAASIEHPAQLRTGDPAAGGEFAASDDPLRLFAIWFAEATKSEPTNPEAMALATVDADGLPNARMVLLKGYDENGFVFYTNLDSPKARELKGAPRAALAFYWKSLQRQVRLRGSVEPVSETDADCYFATRPRTAQIGAWASKQSAPLESRLAFERAIARYTAKFAIGVVPRPPHWSGYRVVPLTIEFWRERPFRLHDRLAFTRPDRTSPWRKTRLYP